MDNNDILVKVNKLVQAHRQGLLGGEKMPEDENPHLEKASKQNYMYFTLPMALNYQRNSYVLWECANRMYADENAKSVFDSREVCTMPEELLRKRRGGVSEMPSAVYCGRRVYRLAYDELQT